MDEYIPRHEAIRAVQLAYGDYEATRKALYEIPAADVAPVVRCKDCKHRWEDIGGLCCSHGVCIDCTVPEDFFCADGKRKNDFVDDNKIGERKNQ